MFPVRHRAYVDHPVASNRAIRRASLYPHEVGYVSKEIIHTYGEWIQTTTKKNKLNKGNARNHRHPPQTQPGQRTRIAIQSVTTPPAAIDSVYVDWSEKTI